MPFLECGTCGGYYELQDGESIDDFDVCQCGGELKYFNSLHEFLDDAPSSYHQNNSKTSKNKSGFSFWSSGNDNPGNEQYGYSSATSNHRNSLNRRSPGGDYGQYEENSRGISLSKPSFLKRISFLGLFCGLCLTLSCCFVSYVLFFDYLYNTAVNLFSSTGNIVTTISVLGFEIYGILFIISVLGSAVTTFISDSRSYGDGLLNGFLLGVIIVSAIVLLVNSKLGMSLALMSTFVLGSIFISLTTFGGFVGIAFRKIVF